MLTSVTRVCPCGSRGREGAEGRGSSGSDGAPFDGSSIVSSSSSSSSIRSLKRTTNGSREGDLFVIGRFPFYLRDARVRRRYRLTERFPKLQNQWNSGRLDRHRHLRRFSRHLSSRASHQWHEYGHGCDWQRTTVRREAGDPPRSSRQRDPRPRRAAPENGEREGLDEASGAAILARVDRQQASGSHCP